MDSEDKQSYYAAILFLIWPFLSVISAFRNYKSSWAKNICWAFIAFYGFTFTISSESTGSDINDYIAGYQEMHTVDMSFADAVEEIKNSSSIDIVEVTISIVMSRISDSPVMLTLAFAFVFGFFFSRNIWFVFNRLEGPLKPITLLLLTCFLLIVPIWEMNGFRMWTAAHVFFYGLFPYLFDGNKKKLLVSATSVLFHFSFIVPLLVLIGYLVAGNRTTIYIILFVGTLFVSDLNIQAFNNLVESYAPEVLQERTSSYRSESKVESYREGDYQENTVWYAIYYIKGLRWSVAGLLILIFFRGKDFFNENKGYLNIYSFVLLFGSAANLLSSIPSGSRYYSVASLFALAFLILYLQNVVNDKIMKRAVWLSTPLLLLFIVVSIRRGFYTLSVSTFLGNPLIAMISGGEYLSLNDLLKTVL